MRPMGSVAFVMCLIGLGSAGGSTAQQPSAGPKTLFTAPLADLPGFELVVVELKLPPRQEGRPAAPGHRHPGSVWVYVTEGTARLGLAGEPVREVKAGESFFEPVGAIHNVSESTSATEPATGFAVMLVPKGAALATPVETHAGH